MARQGGRGSHRVTSLVSSGLALASLIITNDEGDQIFCLHLQIFCQFLQIIRPLQECSLSPSDVDIN